MTAELAIPATTSGPSAIDPGRCWSLYEHYTVASFAKHFPTLDEAVAAALPGDKGIVHVECSELKCVKKRYAASRAAQDLQRTTENTAAAVQRGWRLVADAQAQISAADTKAGFVVGIGFALLGLAGSGALGVTGPLRWAALAFLLAAVLAAGWAVFPRMSRRHTGPTSVHLNFGAVRGLSPAKLQEGLRTVDELVAVSREAVMRSRILHAKYRAVRWAVRVGLVGLVLAVAAAVVGSR
jgi:hypothetical protein